MINPYRKPFATKEATRPAPYTDRQWDQFFDAGRL